MIDSTVRIFNQTKYFPETSELRPYNIREVIEKVGSNFRVKIVIEGNCVILADDFLVSVFDNLIRNAIDHGREDTIVVRIEPKNEFCSGIIYDNGVGIAKEIREKYSKKVLLFLQITL